jgi:hypothetical protein
VGVMRTSGLNASNFLLLLTILVLCSRGIHAYLIFDAQFGIRARSSQDFEESNFSAGE